MGGGGFPIADVFECYVCYYLHNGFKICMLLKCNVLLVITLIICQLNIYVFQRITLFHASDKKNVFLLLKMCTVVAIFKCLQKTVYKR